MTAQKQSTLNHPSIFTEPVEMNEFTQKSLYEHLYNILDKFTTDRLQCYLLACQEQKEFDGVRVAANILRVRYINGE